MKFWLKNIGRVALAVVVAVGFYLSPATPANVVSAAPTLTVLGTNQIKDGTSPWTALSSLSLTADDYVFVCDAADSASSKVTVSDTKDTFTAGSTQLVAFGTNLLSMSFSASSSYSIIGVSLKLGVQTAPPGNAVINLYAVDANHKPTGSSLANGTIAGSSIGTLAFLDCFFTSAYSLTSGTEYSIVLSSPTSVDANHCPLWNCDTSYGATGYGFTSNDSGSTWVGSYDFNYKTLIGAVLTADATGTGTGIVNKIWSGKVDTTTTTYSIVITNTSTAKAMTAYKCSGIVSSSARDAYNSNTGTGTTATTNATGTLAQADELVIVASAVEDEIDDAQGTWSTAAGYIGTNAQIAATNGGGDTSNVQAHSAAKIVTATTSVQGSDGTHDSSNWAGTIASYKLLPNAPTNLVATTFSTTSVDLSWALGTSSDTTMIRYRSDGTYPTSIADGTQAYLDTGTSTSVGSLSASTTYKFRAWAVNAAIDPDQYSVETADLTVTTLGSGMQQMIIGGKYDSLNNAADEYNSIQSGFNWDATVANVYQIAPTSGVFSRLSVELADTPGTNPYAFTFYKNGSATALTVTIAADGTSAIDTTNSVAVVAGDLIALQSSRPSGNPANTPYARWSIIFEGDTANESILMGCVASTSAGTVYVPLMGSSTTYRAATESQAYSIIPTNGAIKKLYINLSVDPGTSPDAYTFTLRLGNAGNSYAPGDSALTCSVVADNTTGNDVAHSVDVAPADIVDLAIVPVSSPSASPIVRYSMVFLADTEGESIILGGSSDNPSTASAEYNFLSPCVYNVAWTSTEANFYQGGQDNSVVLQDFYVWQSANSGAGGSGDSWEWRIMGSAGATNITITISEANQTGSDTSNTYTVTTTDELHIRSTPASTPTAVNAHWGVVCYITTGGATPSVTNSPTTLNLGTLNPSSTYYAKGFAPQNPVVQGDCTFYITVSDATADVYMLMNDFTGGVGWNIAAGAPGSNEVKIVAYYVGQNPASGLVLSNAAQLFKASVAAGTLYWDFQIDTGSSFTDGTTKTGILVISVQAA